VGLPVAQCTTRPKKIVSFKCFE